MLLAGIGILDILVFVIGLSIALSKPAPQSPIPEEQPIPNSTPEVRSTRGPAPASSQEVDCTEFAAYAAYSTETSGQFVQYIELATNELSKSDSDIDLDYVLKLAEQVYNLADEQDEAFDLNSMGMVDLDAQLRQAMKVFASGLDRFARGKKLGNAELVATGVSWLNEYTVYLEKARDQIQALSEICK